MSSFGYIHFVDKTYTSVIKRAGKWWLGWIKDVTGVNCQESTLDALLETLRVTLAEQIEMNQT
jgi:hypothetical protein